MVVPVGQQLADTGGTPNGRPDPGETVDLVATLRNFGAPATGVQVELSATDPYLTVTDATAAFGDIGAGEAVANTLDPLTFAVAASSPTGRAVELSVRATFAGGETLSRIALIIGRLDYLVWDPTSDQSSGPVIAATLANLGFSGSLSQTLPVNELDRYSTLWASFGIYPQNHVVASSDAEGPAIVGFLAGGGSVYLEGGDTWAYDPTVGGFDFRPSFGLGATQDGSGDLAHVLGRPGELTEGMDFVYAGESSYIDHLVPTAAGVAILGNSSPAYDCAIAADAGSHRTVAASFELGGLQDGVAPSTRETLAAEVMGFLLGRRPAAVFADGFESGDASAWSATAP